MTKYNLPIHLESELNLREHWTKRHRRFKAHKKAALVIARHKLPCVVTITRIGKGHLDDDNLRGACKGIRDGIAARLGVDDASPLVTWRYGQQRGEYGAVVRIDPC